MSTKTETGFLLVFLGFTRKCETGVSVSCFVREKFFVIRSSILYFHPVRASRTRLRVSKVSEAAELSEEDCSSAPQKHSVKIPVGDRYVVFYRNEHLFKIVVDGGNEVELMVQTRHLKDVIILVIRGLAQRFNSISLNSLLKVDN